MQLFVSDTGFMYVYPMKVKIEIVNAVKAFAEAIGVPTALKFDPEATHRTEALKKAANDTNLPLKFLERRTGLAELYIGLLKEAFIRT